MKKKNEEHSNKLANRQQYLIGKYKIFMTGSPVFINEKLLENGKRKTLLKFVTWGSSF